MPKLAALLAAIVATVLVIWLAFSRQVTEQAEEGPDLEMSAGESD